jgi:tetratricopeptide (TPR) repeat protein
MRQRNRRSDPVRAPAADASSWGWLAGIAGGALALRLAHVVALRDTPFGSLLVGDSRGYHDWAVGVAAGNWLGSEVFYQAPLYPYLLAVYYALVDADAYHIRVLQAFVGAISCVVLAHAGRRFFDRRTGLLAAGLLAIYPPAIFFDGLIQKASLDLFLVSAFVASVGACLEGPKRRWLVMIGLSLGALSLNRENARILWVVVAGWLFLYFPTAPVRDRLRWTVIVTAAMALVLLPVAIRNKVVGGQLVLSTFQAGSNFYIGNRRGASGTYEPLLPGRANVTYERADATRVAEKATGHRMNAGEISAYWWQKSRDDIRAAPGEWLRLLFRKLRLTFWAHELPDTESIEAYAAVSPVLRALRWWDFGVLMGLAAIGAWARWSNWRKLAFLYATFGALAASIVLFFVLGRYRFPLVPLVALFAAAGLQTLWKLRRASILRLSTATLGAVVVAAILHVPVQPSPDPTYLNYGSELLDTGRPVDAEPLLRVAVRIDPNNADPRLILGYALQQAGRNQEAIDEFRRAVSTAPNSAEPHRALAAALHREGNMAEAIASYQRALSISADASTLSNLGLAYYESGDSNAAIASFQRGISIDSKNVQTRLNLCNALAETRSANEALACLTEAAQVAQRPEDIMFVEFAFAQTLASTGRKGEALRSIERALSALQSAQRSERVSEIERSLRELQRLLEHEG